MKNELLPALIEILIPLDPKANWYLPSKPILKPRATLVPTPLSIIAMLVILHVNQRHHGNHYENGIAQA